MQENKIFDAFLYIRPIQNDSTSPKFSDAQVLWNYPTDISATTRDLRDTSQFCFPDLEVIKIERAEVTKCEHFISTLTSSDGTRIYAICMRIMPQGQRRRYDVKRRPKDCLCIITKHAYFSMFRVLLQQIHALSILSTESSSTSASTAPSIAHNLLAQVFHSSIPPRGESLILRRNAELNMSADLNLFIPRHGGLLRKEVLIRPLLEALGVEKFLLILSALLCERRLIFISENIDTLAEAVHAANAMLYPFTWQHVFVPVLPSKLLSYAAAPMPFIIGVRKYLTERLSKEALEDVIIVDLELGDCTTYGESTVRDIVGSAAFVQAPTITNAMKQQASEGLKQASEGFDRFRSVAAKILLGNNSNSGSGASPASATTSSTTPPISNKVESEAGKDLMSILVSELRGALARKPGPPGSSGGSINNLVRMGLTGSRSAADISHDRWASECERTLRECLLFFFVYLFYDLEPRPATSSITTTPQYECNNVLPISSGGSNISNNSNDTHSFSSRQMSSNSDNGQDFDDFITRLQDRGETKEITEFLSEVMHSQMFEQFRGERAARRGFGSKSPKDGSSSTGHRTGTSGSGVDATGGGGGGMGRGLGKSIERSSIDRDFEMGCAEVRTKPYPVPPLTVKLIVSQLLTRIDASLVLPTNAQQAQAAGFDVAEAIKAAESDFHPIALQLTSNTAAFTIREEYGMIEKLCIHAAHSQHFPRIMRTIWFRLEDCKGPNWKHGHKALQLLKSLLLKGPEIVLAESLNRIDLLISITKQGPSQSITLNFGTELDLRPDAYEVLFLVLDHHRLLVRRKYSALLAAGAFTYLSFVPQRRDLMIRNGQTGLLLPDFKALHNNFGQKMPNSVPRLPEEASAITAAGSSNSGPSKPSRPLAIKRGGLTQQKLAVMPVGDLDLFNDSSTDFNSLFKDINLMTPTTPTPVSATTTTSFPTSSIFDSFATTSDGGEGGGGLFTSNSGNNYNNTSDPFVGNNPMMMTASFFHSSALPPVESSTFSFTSSPLLPPSATATATATAFGTTVSDSSFQPLTTDPWGGGSTGNHHHQSLPVSQSSSGGTSTVVGSESSGWDRNIITSDVWGGSNSSSSSSNVDRSTAAASSDPFTSTIHSPFGYTEPPIATPTTPFQVNGQGSSAASSFQPLPSTAFGTTPAPPLPPPPGHGRSHSRTNSTGSLSGLAATTSAVQTFGSTGGSAGSGTSITTSSPFSSTPGLTVGETVFSEDPFAADPFASYSSTGNTTSHISGSTSSSSTSGFAPDPFFGMVLPASSNANSNNNSINTTTTIPSSSSSTMEIGKEFTPWNLDCDWPTIPPEPTLTIDDLLPPKPPKPSSNSYTSYGYQSRYPSTTMTSQNTSYANYQSMPGTVGSTGTASGSNMTYLVQKKPPADPFADLVSIKK